MKHFHRIVTLILSLLICLPGVRGAEPTADRILEMADEVRNPQSDFTVDVTVTSIKPGKNPGTAKYEVMVKGKTKTIIKTMAPAVDRGTSMLMVDYDFWVFLPTVTKALRISLQQRLLGEVANGDIARVNFSGDYAPKLLKTERIENRDYYVLELIAKDDRVTYHRVLLWVEKGNYHPLKAEFYAVSGRILKIASYENYRQVAGKLRPTRLVLDDPTVKGQRSIIDYTNVVRASLPDRIFNQQYLRKLTY
ncbi:MAG: outer membrane lipoprotein-sorting protein [Acidobacteriota bacterium]|jgi:outer membrane lipoprotein-sorting protein|nr:outer membrane lipoprotein-sorting protein [Acidobacteriota bacterium]